MSYETLDADHDTPQNPVNSSSHAWSSPPYTIGRKEARWMDGFGELFVEDVSDLELDANYRVRYREGRFVDEDLPYNEFDSLEDAMKYAELLVKEAVELEDIRF